MEQKAKKGRSIISIIKNLRRFRKPSIRAVVPERLFEKCDGCGELVSKSSVEKRLFTCPECDYHFNISAKARMDMLLDEYTVINRLPRFTNPIDFPGYKVKYRENRKKSGLKEGILGVEGYIEGIRLVAVSLDNSFFMGSMGSYIGEEVARAFEYAGKRDLPILVFSTSGGARMQEGIFSLMQMAKTSIAVDRYGETRNLYISCMTHPTTGGVTASFASLGDVILAEPGALIGFAGARVIKETIKGELPKGFQRAEFLRDRGFLDDIVHREHMRDYIHRLLKLHGYRSCRI
ncbi:MAG TPA: acetyl-CoA carboxylase carboxyl transferase subunit beta [Tepidimicrobium sp.]|nr:acetyl-CoA carboxylase carboxyl transferase subunit beta [Tepidimicrobium sp.]